MASARESPGAFIAWLQSELDKRHWSWSRLSQEADVVPSLFAKAKTGEKSLGPTVLRRVSEALGISQVEVFRRAGLIDEGAISADELAELGRLLSRIPDSERTFIISGLQDMVRRMGERYVESQSDAADHAVDADADPAHADP